jgi:hypothetical protein
VILLLWAVGLEGNRRKGRKGRKGRRKKEEPKKKKKRERRRRHQHLYCFHGPASCLIQLQLRSTYFKFFPLPHSFTYFFLVLYYLAGLRTRLATIRHPLPPLQPPTSNLQSTNPFLADLLPRSRSHVIPCASTEQQGRGLLKTPLVLQLNFVPPPPV